MKFPPDLVARVRSSISRVGYCFLNTDELHRLLGGVPASLRARHEAIEEFADLCGADVETTTHLKSARFTPDGANRDAVSSEEELRRIVSA